MAKNINLGHIVGRDGVDGAPGRDGLDGAAATVEVGIVTTGEPGTQAAVTNGGTTAAAVLNFVIPRGAPGTNGKSAYQAAVEKGYTGTEEEFNTALAGMQDAPFLPVTGGDVAAVNITGSLTTDGNITVNLNGCRVQGVNGPTSDTDAANKQYVDDLVGNINSLLDAINGEVV